MAKTWDWIVAGSGKDIGNGGKTVMVGNKYFQRTENQDILIPASGQAPSWLNNLTLRYVFGPGPNSSGQWESWGA